MVASNEVILTVLVAAPVLGVLFALYNTWVISRVSYRPGQEGALLTEVSVSEQKDGAVNSASTEAKFDKVREISDIINRGAHSFLYREYTYLAVFIFVFFFVVLVAVGASTKDYTRGALTATSFAIGAITSIFAGLLGMKIAVGSNGKTAINGTSVAKAFDVAFRAGSVMGFTLVSMGLIFLLLIIYFFGFYWGDDTATLYATVSGYGLGSSSVALFGRVGGGIYTKAADVGADLVGKNEAGIPEDDPRNPAVIADNVGDNVGDIAGMGSDLFGSFAESTCAALVIASESATDNVWALVSFPMIITALGILVSILTTLVAFFRPPRKISEVEAVLKAQIVVSTVINTAVLAVAVEVFLPATFTISSLSNVTRWDVYGAAVAGLWAGLIIGYTTEYYTSKANRPVQELADSCKTGAATNIIYGLALGFQSVIIPVICLALVIYISYSLCGAYGVAIGALGVLSNLATSLAIDGFGPISDNAGGIAEMAGLDEHYREVTDALDAAGNTTAAVGKGFAIASAALVSLALFSAYITTAKLSIVNLLSAVEFAGLIYGAMLPYWFSALTMKSVGLAALSMVEEVRDQFKDGEVLAGRRAPNYDRCIKISTDASLREMLFPGALVMLNPLIIGYLFGVNAQAGVLAGTLVSGVQLAISSSNSGGAWDNAKKFIEAGNLGGKRSPAHAAAVIGDTVGDPLKDTSGPSLNILVKLSAIISLVFVPSFPTTGYVFQLFQ